MAEYDHHLRLRLTRMGRAVRDARVAAGLSQERLADVSGLHRTYVGSVERGERNVSVGSLFVIADALGCDAANFLACA
jgi:transcriptional regulator with XRE-family HTH domain